MKVSLLPRLKKHGVKIISNGFNKNIPLDNSGYESIAANRDLTSYAASGGAKSESLVLYIDKGLREIAQRCGFPTSSNQSSRAQFDQEAAVWLGQIATLKSGEALRDDVWAFISTVLAPDLVIWRYSERSLERFSGGVRNAFQRLWVRGIVLDRGEEHKERWGLIYNLSEDAMVQIFERPSIAANPILAIAIAEEWLKISEMIGRNRMEDVMRYATKVIRIKNQIIDLTFLSSYELEEKINVAFGLAIEHISEKDWRE
ncbi:DUF6339 family protein [Serratia fonticola]|jgi:hypothetical protein|uniref:DUF6339 family protein n=1 Tax=Serratia fonticola TaxID=47917 RepID=UPI002097D38E|nr:DUF6339 family protein [Serratia fonticola]MCO7511749.1 DUF6339 family protein [Serratia fonticola]CAI1538890.1 Uncharacterised protein [Serratia fonticola]CAI1998875.1 Uncharacterised protein [Serratia fonticola]CAI1999201.1 Uncharacterised protein [Serratia fonticola]